MSEQNKPKESPEDFYKRLKTELEKTEEFPIDFTYKFIIPTDNKTIALIKQIFDDANPKFRFNESKNKKYTSITVVIYAIDADQVISFYKKVGEIEGVIML